jgi:GDSL-like Lipase/Acylhydrolase family
MRQIEEQRFGKLAQFATFLLTLSGILCVLALLNSLYDHAWREPRDFSSSIPIFFYYILPAMLAAVLFGSLILADAWRIKLSLLLLSTGISMVAVDLFLAIYDRTVVAANKTLDGSSERDLRDVVKLAKKYGAEYDTRGKLQVIDDLSRKGVKAVPLVAPVNILGEEADHGTRQSVINLDGIEVLPHGGISNRPTVYCNETGQYVIYHSDEHGFHNPKGIWHSAPIEVLTVGDSFTQGACVASEKSFVALIRNHFTKTLNLGMGGNGPLNELGTLIDCLDVLKPKIVLWFFFEGNDLWDLHRERKSPLLMRYLTDGFKQDLLHRQAEVDQALLTFVNRERERFNFTFPATETGVRESLKQAGSLLYDSARLTHLRQKLRSILALLLTDFNQSDARTMAAINLLPNVLRQAKARSEAAGSKFYFVYLPQRERYSDATFTDDTRHRVLTIVKELKMPLIDIHAAFQQHGDPLDLFPFRRLYHYNEKGHQLVSDVVLQHLSR